MDRALHIELPDFLARANAASPVIADPGARMAYVLALVRDNIEQGGGPFAAAVFERDSGRLVSAGANRVVDSRCSAAHAEVLALSLAQARLRTHDLGSAGLPAFELVASAEPCTMCLGAVLWSGVRGLVCAARCEDVVALGFDEGVRLPDWIGELQRRGIAVKTDRLRDEARALLEAYRAAGGPIYNARRGGRG